ncbi:MAG: UDP-2,3-diacylglucosamine diphosphatase [Bacteroidales bacterium]|nr:UDP-2,3-diacylglucosamine diphosphatase [Bacteroidales bacterium]
MERRLTYFVADAHLGLEVGDPAERERRFTAFLRSIDPAETEALYLLGDIFDFWYEYRDVVPKGYSRVFAALLDLMDGGVKVYFFEGNHDVWTYHYFEELGMVRLAQPAVVQIGGKTFCLGHGDGLGPGRRGYKFLRWVFHNRVLQFLFSLLHPWIAFRIGVNWSSKGPHTNIEPYVFKGEDEPLYKFAASFADSYASSADNAADPRARKIDYFIFGHYHVHVDINLPVSEVAQPVNDSTQPASGPRFMILKDWLDSSSYILFDGSDCRYID